MVCLFWYVLATFKVISGRVPTCDSTHSWQHYNAASLVYLTTRTRTWYPTQSLYPNTELTSHCPIPIMLSARLGSDKNKFLSHWFDSTRTLKNGRRTLYSFSHPVGGPSEGDHMFVILLPDNIKGLFRMGGGEYIMSTSPHLTHIKLTVRQPHQWMNSPFDSRCWY